MAVDKSGVQLDRQVTAGAHMFSAGTGFTGLRWSPVAGGMTDAARAYLRAELPSVAVQAFTGTTEAFWGEWLADDKLDDLSGLVVIIDDAGHPAGWVAGNTRLLGGKRCFYANSAGVHPRHQGAGLSKLIWRELLTAAIRASAPRRLYAVMRTANPIVYSGWSAAAGGRRYAYPAPGVQPPDLVRRIAADLATDLGQRDRFDPETFVISDAYDSTATGLWLERPRSDHPDIDDWLYALLGPRDAITLVVVFDPVTIVARETVRGLRRRFSGLGSAVRGLPQRASSTSRT